MSIFKTLILLLGFFVAPMCLANFECSTNAVGVSLNLGRAVVIKNGSRNETVLVTSVRKGRDWAAFLTENSIAWLELNDSKAWVGKYKSDEASYELTCAALTEEFDYSFSCRHPEGLFTVKKEAEGSRYIINEIMTGGKRRDFAGLARISEDRFFVDFEVGRLDLTRLDAVSWSGIYVVEQVRYRVTCNE